MVLYNMVHRWMRRVSKGLVSRRRTKREASNSLYTVHFKLRQDAERFMLGKYLGDKEIPWQRRRRLGMAVAGNTPTASFLIKIGNIQPAGCAELDDSARGPR